MFFIDIQRPDYFKIEVPIASKTADHIKLFIKNEKTCHYCYRKVTKHFGLLTDLTWNTLPITIENYVACTDCLQEFKKAHKQTAEMIRKKVASEQEEKLQRTNR